MKLVSLLGMGLLLLMTACQKNLADLPAETIVKPNKDTFVTYTILQGLHYSDQAPNIAVNYVEQKFQVLFDSSAIYQTTNPSNQGDINKLYGFSDNNQHHHNFSARFGWRWFNNQLEVFAYVYNNEMLSFKKIGNATIGQSQLYTLKIEEGNYVFSLAEQMQTLARKSTTPTAIGYKLYPYFGGNEVAPHNIKIVIEEM